MVTFFGKVDLNKAGKIASHMPAWTMQPQIEELEEEIGRKERSLERGEVPLDNIPQTKEELNREKTRLADILGGKPKLSETEENKLHKVYKDLGTSIKSSMFTRSDMLKGVASPHEEVRRMKGAVIGIDKETASLCEANGIQIKKNDGSFYVSRDGASKMWKIVKKYFNENSNVEVLRKD